MATGPVKCLGLSLKNANGLHLPAFFLSVQGWKLMTPILGKLAGPDTWDGRFVSR